MQRCALLCCGFDSGIRSCCHAVLGGSDEEVRLGHRRLDYEAGVHWMVPYSRQEGDFEALVFSGVDATPFD